MDNDIKIVKQLKSVYKALKFKIEYLNKSVLSEEAGNNLIFQKVNDGMPCMIVRLGSVETRCIYPWIYGKEVEQKTIENGMYCAGIFPPTKEGNSIFSKIYSDAISKADIMALCNVYKEKTIVNKYCASATLIRARSIEPYYFENPWTRALKGKRVLIVHPFTDSIKKQYLKREKIFANQNVLPQFKSIEFVRAVQSNAGADSEFLDWNSAYLYMCNEIAKVEFDIAIIGAGAYALPLAAFVKSIGKISIQMSGATQLLFGIKGFRWDNHPIISKFYNEDWTRPSADETPPKIEKVEGGSYW
ncbi:hypothetical protein V5E38_18580 [Rossellomorea sp. GAMAL-10_SWC]